MKRYINLAITALVATSFAFGAVNVSAASRSNASLTPPKLKTGVTLTVWDYFCTASQHTCPERDTEWKVIQQWAKATHNKVNFPTNPDSHDQKLCTAGPSGQGPDLIAGPHNELGPMVACGTLAPIPAWAWTPAQQKTYIKAAVQAVTLSGHPYAMPWAIETTGLFYNKDLISAGAFKPAKGQTYQTWSRLISNLKKLSVPGGGPPFGWDQANFYFDYAFISGNGGYVFKYVKGKGYDYNQLGLDSAGAVKAYQFLYDLTTNGKYKLYSPSMNDSVAAGLFNGGKLPVYYTGPWNIASFKQNNLKFGFEPLPSFNGKTPSRPFSGVQDFAINRFTKHLNEAASLDAYLTKNMQVPEFKTSGRIPVITSILNSKAIQKDPVEGGLAHAALAASPMPNIPEMNEVWTPMGTAIGDVEQGKASAADAAKAAVAQIKAAIAKAHGG
ncbi:MAG TPA: extracellular solute-binding protein [Chloroflexota bacterium]|nr:extracellular solute-binding protein [Chloroflexota bacterium]